MFHPVYQITSLGGGDIDHHALFVETNTLDGTGYIFQVVGNIQAGMQYGHTPSCKPEDSVTSKFIEKVVIGVVSAINYERIKNVLVGVEAPKKQFDGPRRIYPREPLRRCQDWTREAIQVLRDEGVLEDYASVTVGSNIGQEARAVL